MVDETSDEKHFSLGHHPVKKLKKKVNEIDPSRLSYDLKKI